MCDKVKKNPSNKCMTCITIVETNIVKVDHMGVDASYCGSLLWWNSVFSLGTIYSNAYGD
jgi:hypothetical protein